MRKFVGNIRLGLTCLECNIASPLVATNEFAIDLKIITMTNE